MSDFAKNLFSASNLQLWKSYCDKKIECENLQDQLTTITKQRDELREILQLIYDECKRSCETALVHSGVAIDRPERLLTESKD